MPAAPALTPSDAATLLLHALAWCCADEARATRLLSLTGLDPDDLRARAADPAVLVAVGRFLGDHEPDLIACAAALDVTPARLASAEALLGGPAWVDPA
jgi:hypothetical protein